MIPISIDDPVVLRRTLEDIEAKLPKLSAPLSNISSVTLDGTNDINLVADKLNDLIVKFNALSTELNKTTKNRI